MCKTEVVMADVLKIVAFEKLKTVDFLALAAEIEAIGKRNKKSDC